MTAGLERRAFEFRESGEGVIGGVVIPYNSPGKVGGFTERFLPGSVTFGDVIANRQHDRAKPLARTDGGGLVLSDSTEALRARIDLPDTVDGRDVRELVQRKVLRGLSAEFRVQRDAWEGQERIIHEATLSGIGVVDRGGVCGRDPIRSPGSRRMA